MNKQTERLISADKLLEWINGNWEMERTAGTKESQTRSEMWHEFYQKVISEDLTPDPVPTLKPGDTRQLLHNTLDVMTDKQVRILGRTIGLEPIKEDKEDGR